MRSKSHFKLEIFEKYIIIGGFRYNSEALRRVSYKIKELMTIIRFPFCLGIQIENHGKRSSKIKNIAEWFSERQLPKRLSSRNT